MSCLPATARAIITSRQRKVFLVGAGISKDPPTLFPLASELISAFLECISQAVPAFIGYVNLVEQAVRQPPAAGYRLEVLLEMARQGIGDRVLKVLSFLEHGVPNVFHNLLALYLAKGHIIVTTNFDTMIEDAYERITAGTQGLTVILTEKQFEAASRSLPLGGLLIKLHGSVRNVRGKPSYRSIQITLASMANGLSRGKKRLLERLLQEQDFIVLGYSGNDDFDINPVFLASKAGRRFLWVKHSATPLTVWPQDSLPVTIPKDDTIRCLLQGKTNSFLIEGQTKEFLRLLPGFKTASSAVGVTPPSSVSWREILKQSFRSDLVVSRIDCVRYIAKILEYNSHLDLARACFEDSLKHAHAVERAVLLDDLGQCCLLSRDMAASLSCRLSARKVASRFDSKTARLIVARSWLGIGECLRNTTRYSTALRAFKKAATLFGALGMHDRVGYCLSGIGGIYRMTSRFDAAEDSYHRALAEFRSGKDLPGRLYALWGLAEVLKYRGDFGKPLEAYTQVRRQAEKLGHDRLTALSLWGEAELLRLQFHISDALYAYTEALNRFPATDTAGRSWALEGIAQCNILQGVSPLSELRSATVGFEKLHAVIGQAAVKLDEVTFHLSQAQPGSAWETLQQVQITLLPSKDVANYRLLLAEYQFATADPRFLRTYVSAATAYRRLGMDYAFVAAVILMAKALPRSKAIRSKLWHSAKAIATRRRFRHECMVIQDIEAARNPQYLVNLC